MDFWIDFSYLVLGRKVKKYIHNTFWDHLFFKLLNVECRYFPKKLLLRPFFSKTSSKFRPNFPIFSLRFRIFWMNDKSKIKLKKVAFLTLFCYDEVSKNSLKTYHEGEYYEKNNRQSIRVRGNWYIANKTRYQISWRYPSGIERTTVHIHPEFPKKL